MKPYYDQDWITIYHGDCREVLPALGFVDLILTDPPYGIGKAPWDCKFEIPWDLFSKSCAVLGITPGVWNITNCPRKIGQLEYKWCLAAHLKNGMTRWAIGFGNWIPLLIWDAGERPLFRLESDCRDFAIGTEAKPDHPSPKPLNVMKWFLGRLPGDLVLDPFMGSGTTLVAAKQLGRRAIGIEIEERYCEVAVRRLAQGALFGPGNQP